MIPSVFQIPIEGPSLPSVLDRALTPSASGAFWIVTANPEILLAARSDEAYAKTLRQADTRMVDGFGLWLMLRLTGCPTFRVSGGALADGLLALAHERNLRVALLGAEPGVADEAARQICERFPGLSVLAESGGKVTSAGEDDEAGDEARHRLTLFAPQILFVAFGHPKQERWIARYSHEFPSLLTIVGLGGVLDVWSGRVRPAPALLRQLGLEWVWRLMLQPRRWKRILRAVFVFPLFFMIDRLTSKS